MIDDAFLYFDCSSVIRELYEIVGFEFGDIITKTENVMIDYVLENFPLKDKDKKFKSFNFNYLNTLQNEFLNEKSIFYNIKFCSKFKKGVAKHVKIELKDDFK